MSLTISGSSPTYAYAKDTTAEETSSSEANSAAAAAVVPKSQYLGGYISSATAALSLLTQTATEFSQRNQTTSVGPNGTTVDTSGEDFFQEAAGLGNNVFAQVFKSSTNFGSLAGTKTANGEYDAAVASVTTGSDGAAQSTDSSSNGFVVTAKISTGTDALQGTNDTSSGLNVLINVGGDPKQNDKIFINLNQNNDDPSIRQGLQDEVTQYLEYEGLDETSAKAQSSQIASFVLSAADKLASPSVTTASTSPFGASGPATTPTKTTSSSLT